MDVNQVEGPHYKIVPAPGSSRLLVFFAGTNKTNGKFDFWRVGNSQKDHKLFLNNGKNEWYQSGIPGFADNVSAVGRRIEQIATALGATEIVLHGVSMGGYAAALFARLIGCRAMAFGFDSILKVAHSRSAQISRTISMIFPDLSKVSAGQGSILHIAGEVDAMDLKAANHLLNSGGVKTLTLRGVGHGGAPFIDYRYGLSEFIRKFSAGENMPNILECGRAARSKPLVDSLVDLHVCAKAKDWRKAEQVATAALELDASSETAHYWLGTALLENKQASRAVNHLAMAVASAPHFTNAQYRLARAFMALNDHERSKFHMAEHARLSPDSALAQMFLSDLTRKEGNTELANELLMKAWELAPENKSVLARMDKHSVPMLV